MLESEFLKAAEQIRELEEAVSSVLFGRRELVRLTITGLLAGGHLLLEGLPGLGKTELVKAIGAAIDLDVRRIQFTPDLLPGDITGNPMLDHEGGRHTLVFQPGPVFTNILLADEINRASPKTQSALLEAMQEGQVTILGDARTLPSPFFVLATQNPIELEGTYPLPEAQLDRFLFKITVTKATRSVLEQIVRGRANGAIGIPHPVLDRAQFLSLMDLTRKVFLPEPVIAFIARLVEATHAGYSKASEGVRYGASPRAALALSSGARANALMDGRPNVSFEDVRSIAAAVLHHRIILDYRTRVTGTNAEAIIQNLLDEIPTLDHKLPSNLSRV